MRKGREKGEGGRVEAVTAAENTLPTAILRRGLLPLFLVGLWLLLNDTLELAHLLLAVLLALFLDRAIRRLRPLPAWPRRFWLSLQLIGRVFADIVRSNIAVGAIILGATKRQPTIGFMEIPLELTNPHGLAMLSVIITSTPGTVWAAHDPERNIFTMHVLDLIDEAGWRNTIKTRYERPLMEIFPWGSEERGVVSEE